ncbi:hypothetical protein GCM10010269_14160 [Streptomyces humidus]|uniref:Uncharacterized protein n=1 Tax=Streptomyces humidus TaxID=52259 RepID=A0A918FSE3_9ACTN|nr:hypothetical protein GCM10010269_14160 [Streptomyces humidus]
MTRQRPYAASQFGLLESGDCGHAGILPRALPARAGPRQGPCMRQAPEREALRGLTVSEIRQA